MQFQNKYLLPENLLKLSTNKGLKLVINKSDNTTIMQLAIKDRT